VARSRFTTLKLSGSIRLARNGKLSTDKASAVLYLAPPDRLRLRVYKLGIPVVDLLYREGDVWSRPEGDTSAYRALVSGLFPTLLWWQEMKRGDLTSVPDSLLLRRSEQAIWLSPDTLMPLYQEFVSPAGPVCVQYSEPIQAPNGRTFPSHIVVTSPEYSAIVIATKVNMDESFGTDIFTWPSD